MPTYSYQCTNCQTFEDIQQTITEQPATPICQKCRQPMTRKFGIQTIKFKGTGWGKD